MMTVVACTAGRITVLSMMTVVACTAGRIPSVVNDDSCGVHSRPYHSGCVIACVMQVREEHAMGYDPGVQTTETRLALRNH